MASVFQFQALVVADNGKSDNYDLVSSVDWRKLASDEAAKLLNDASESSRRNLERINTWTGRCHLKDAILRETRPTSPEKPTSDGLFMRRSEASVTFICDLKRNSINSKFVPVGQFQYDDLVTAETNSVEPSSAENWSILTPENYLEFHPKATFGALKGDPHIRGWRAQKSRVAHRRSFETGSRSSLIGDVFDPRVLFSAPGANSPHIDLAQAAKNIKDGEDSGAEVSVYQSKNDAALFRIRTQFNTSNGDEVVTFYTDVRIESVAGVTNVTAMHNDVVLSTCDINHEDVKGILIPSEYNYVQYDGSGNVKLRRKVIVKENALNQPLDGSLFTVAALGLQKGDRLVDDIANVILLVDENSALISVDEFQQRHSEGFGEHKNRTNLMGNVGRQYYLVVINIIAICVLICLVARRRYLRTRVSG